MKSPTKQSASGSGGSAKAEPAPVGGYVLAATAIAANAGSFPPERIFG